MSRTKNNLQALNSVRFSKCWKAAQFSVSKNYENLEANYRQILFHLRLPNSDINSNSNNNFSPRTLEVLQDLRQSGSFCDCIVKTSAGEEFLAHRAILGAASPVFMEIFREKISEENDQQNLGNILHVELEEIDGATLKIVIDYVYTGRFGQGQGRETEILDVGRACSVFAWANRLIMPNLVEAIGNFLRTNLLDVSNCLAVFKCATVHQPGGEFYQSVKWFTLRHFGRAIENQLAELTNEISEDELSSLLDDDWLNAAEEKVFDVIVAWILNNTKLGHSNNEKLWSTLRYGLLPIDFFFEQVHRHPLIPQNIAEAGVTFFSRFVPIIDRRRESLVPLNFKHQIHLNDKFSRPRFPASFLFAFGGWSGGACTSRCEVYDFSVDKWRRIFDVDNGPRAYQRTILLNNVVYIIGGFDGHDHYSGCRLFNPESGEWREIAPMNYRRCYVSGCARNGCIYVLGGCDKTVRLNHGEVYDPSTNQWTMLTSNMSAKRSDSGCTAVSLNNNGNHHNHSQSAIVICGGFDGFSCLDSAEIMTFRNNNKREEVAWSPLPPMTTRRSGVSICYLSGFVYALGGYDGVSRLNSVERFDFIRQEWRTVAPMLKNRSNFAATVFNEKIIICGGFDGQQTISDCECYDPKTDTWSRICSMIDDRSALSCCLVFGDTDDENDKNHDGTAIKTQMANYVYPRSQLNITVESHLNNGEN